MYKGNGSWTRGSGGPADDAEDLETSNGAVIITDSTDNTKGYVRGLPLTDQRLPGTYQSLIGANTWSEKHKRVNEAKCGGDAWSTS